MDSYFQVDVPTPEFPIPAGPSFLMGDEIRSSWWDGLHFHCYPLSGAISWNAHPGVYIFSRLDPLAGEHHALYIGKADPFSTRIPNHERIAEAQLLGCTHIHALIIRHDDHRQDIERRLIEIFSPTMNHQHNQYRDLSDFRKGRLFRQHIESDIARRHLDEITDRHYRK